MIQFILLELTKSNIYKLSRLVCYFDMTTFTQGMHAHDNFKQPNYYFAQPLPIALGLAILCLQDYKG
jgi:hypothetical protein